MRHLSMSTALIAACLMAGAAWAQGSSGGSSSSSGSSGSGSSSTAAPSAGSSSSGTATRPNNSALRPPGQLAPRNTGQAGNTDVRGAPETLTGNRAIQGGSAVGNTATGSSGSSSGSQGSTGGAAASANRSSTDPDTTGGVAGVNRLQPGERSAVPPTAREEELFRKGEELEQKARDGICSTC